MYKVHYVKQQKKPKEQNSYSLRWIRREDLIMHSVNVCSLADQLSSFGIQIQPGDTVLEGHSLRYNTVSVAARH